MSTKTHGHHHPNHNGHVAVSEPIPQSSTATNEHSNDTDRNRLIEIRAYSMWEDAGKPDGNDAKDRFWCEAEKNIGAMSARDL